MTIAVDLGRKATKQTKKNNPNIIRDCSVLRSLSRSSIQKVKQILSYELVHHKTFAYRVLICGLCMFFEINFFQ